MAVELDNQGDGQGASDGGAVTRPETIPETYWDTEKNTAKFDEIGAALGEVETLRPLKAAADERAGLIPAKPEDYKFELPEGFELPGGYKWTADPKDPIITGFRTLASELKLTQPEVQKLVAFEAGRQANEIKAQSAFDAEQTKALGANAEQRRTAARDWLKANTKPEQAKLLETVLGYALGVEALESIIDKSSHGTRGTGGDADTTNHENAELAAQIGKKPMGLALLQRANSAGK